MYLTEFKSEKIMNKDDMLFAVFLRRAARKARRKGRSKES